MASSFIKHPLTTLPSTPFLVNNKPTHFPNINKPSHTYKTSCKSINNNNQERMFDRRNILIGLGSGLYGVATTSAAAAPILAPDVTNCGPVALPSGTAPTNCCPPPTTQIIDFTLPPPPSKLRLRPAAHLVNDAYVDQFSRAIELMRALPDDDPRSFKQQANIHCAYCNNAYDQQGFSKLELEVHDSWLFFPFHRYYLYFFERILGKLINDTTFAIPFWNWDTPEGMTIPAIYTDPNSPLYDRFRDPLHQPPTVVDLNYDKSDPESGISPEEQIRRNLAVMYRQMVSNSKTSRLFFGSAYRRGEDPNPGAGSIETAPHNTVHTWMGDRRQMNMEDMGSFYSAGRDPVFYAHHSNVDRMWTLWKSFGGRRQDITDPDFLDSGFIFYDEEKRLVRVKIRDCLDNIKLGYEYQKVEIPWVNSRPTPRRVSSDLKKPRASVKGREEVLPAKMDRILKMMVERPKKRRSKREKDEAEEILVIEGIELGRDVNIKFDVYINDEDDVVSTEENSQFAGSFVNVPHHKHGKMIKTQLRLSVTDIMEDLDAEDDDYVVVTLVPTNGGDAVSIQDVKIELGD